VSNEDDKPASFPPVKPARRLAAILHADVHGYSRRIHDDEAGTLQVLTPSLELLRTLVEQHGGRAVGSRGDSLLAEFPSVVEAVQCAVEMQQELRARSTDLPEHKRLAFRIGISLGEIVIDGDQPHGDGINIAVRIEGLAEPGGICIADVVYQQVKNKLPLTYQDLGEQQLKNIPEPVQVWRVRWEGSDSPQSPVHSAKVKVESPKPRRVGTSVFVSVLVSVVLVAGIIAVRYFPVSTPSTQPLTPGTQSPVSSPQSLTPNPQPLSLPDKPSIVVLPFTNMSGDPSQDYFSDGITEVLTSDLSRISSLFVIARNSAFTYKGKATNVEDVGKELGVRYVLEGSVQKASDQVRIVAQLIDATTGGHIWSERYDRPLKDIFALQDEIVQRIVATLKLQLTLQEQGWVVRKHTDNPEAYDFYLRGREYIGRNTKESIAQARQMFEKAFALDPQYAEAQARLGVTYYREWVWRWSADPQTLEHGLALAQKAVALDDSLPIAHSILSLCYAQKQQYDQAIAEGERAIALDPNNADSYASQAEVLNSAGRSEDALRRIEQAMRLNPRYPAFYLLELGWAYRLEGRYAEAVSTLKEAVSRNPTHVGVNLNLAASYIQQWISQQSPDSQALAQALATAQQVVALSDSSSSGHTLLGYIYLWQKQYEQAIAELERAVAFDPNDAWGYAVLAETLSRIGRRGEAIRMGEQALRHKGLVADGHLGSVGAAYYLAGQPEEASASLQRFLIRYRNFLDAHLALAAAYSELGREAEAQAEAAEVLRLNPIFSLEVHRQRVPIKDPALLESHLAALRKAGLK
jgi:adenylate cyclase